MSENTAALTPEVEKAGYDLDNLFQTQVEPLIASAKSRLKKNAAIAGAGVLWYAATTALAAPASIPVIGGAALGLGGLMAVRQVARIHTLLHFKKNIFNGTDYAGRGQKIGDYYNKHNKLSRGLNLAADIAMGVVVAGALTTLAGFFAAPAALTYGLAIMTASLPVAFPLMIAGSFEKAKVRATQEAAVTRAQNLATVMASKIVETAEKMRALAPAETIASDFDTSPKKHLFNNVALGGWTAQERDTPGRRIKAAVRNILKLKP